MKIGTTGTRHGLTLPQLTLVTRELSLAISHELTINYDPDADVHELHHGDCIGVDVQTAAIAAGLGYRTVAHPPNIDCLRGFHPSDVIRPASPYHERDRAIVDATDRLIGCPDGPERPRSGTWYTIRYALRQGRPVVVIYPDGEIARPSRHPSTVTETRG